MLCILYLITPFLRKIVKNKDYKLLEYGFIIFIIASFLNTISLMDFCLIFKPITIIINKFPLEFVLQHYSYFILGYYLYNCSKFKNKKRYYWLALISFFGTMTTTYLVSLKTGNLNQSFYTSFIIFTVLETIGIFLFFNNSKIVGIIADKCRKMIKLIAPCTLGIYLIHLLILNIILNFGFKITSFNIIFTIPLIVLFIFIVSFAIIYLIRKIPVISKYIC